MHRAHETASIPASVASKLALIANRTRSAVAVGRADGTIEWANAAFAHLAGFRPEEVIGSNVRELGSDPALDPDALETLRERFLRGEIHHVELRLTRRSGAPLCVDLEVQPVFDASGRVSDFIAIATDVTERRQTEAALAESELRYRTLVEQSPNPVVVHCEGKLVYVNPATLAMWGGADPAELIGRQVLELVHPDSREVSAARIRAVEDEGVTPEVVEARVLRQDGSCRNVLVHAAPLVHDGKPAVQVVLVDITGRKRQEERQRELDARTHEAYRMESLGVLAAGLAGELAELSRTVVETADHVLTDPSDTSDWACLERARRAGLRTSELTQQLRTFVGGQGFDERPLDLSALLVSAAQGLEAALGERTRLTLDLAGNLPPSQGDPIQVRRALVNLIRNAVEATGPDDGLIHVRTRVLEADPAFLAEAYPPNTLEPGLYVALEVRDNGSGMDASTRARIFDPFFTTRGPGRGLGLTAVLGVMRTHRGGVRIGSAPGAGTTVTLLFPCGAAASGDAPAPRPELSG